jgi:hypothetical protein
MQMQAQQEEQQILSECQKKWQAPRFDGIRSKVSAFEKNISTRYVLIEDKASDSEKVLLLQYADLRDECANKAFDFGMKYVPWTLPALADSRERGLIAFSELYNGRISYGEYNSLGAQSKAMYLEDWQKLQSEYARLSIAAQKNQLQVNLNHLQAARQLSTPQPQLQKSITNTNCRWHGQNMQCTSH